MADVSGSAAAFDKDLLPDYDELRQEVLMTWGKLNPHHQKKGLLIMAMTQTEGGTAKDLQCFSCDGYGHRAGSPDCPDPGKKRSCAPDWWRPRSANGKVGAKDKDKAKEKEKGKVVRSQVLVTSSIQRDIAEGVTIVNSHIIAIVNVAVMVAMVLVPLQTLCYNQSLTERLIEKDRKN